MATPRAVARDMRATATRISKLTDPIVADAATFAVDQGADVGGRFGRRSLTVVVRSSSNRRGRSSVTVAGRTAGAWSIKSYGRRGGYTVRPRRRRALDLRAAGIERAVASAQPRSTSGDDRWRRYIADPTIDEFVEHAEQLVADAVKG